MPKTKYVPMAEEGWTIWVQPADKGEGQRFRQSCCDCGLAHDMEFRVSEDGKVEFRVRRNERATAQLRRRSVAEMGS